MNNVGPVNGIQQLKTGKEFVSELFLSDDDNEDENYEIEDIQEQQNESNSENLNSERDSYNNASDSNNQTESAKKVRFRKETKKFKDEGHNIILNLSKYTLRKIVMLICDEAVGF